MIQQQTSTKNTSTSTYPILQHKSYHFFFLITCILFLWQTNSLFLCLLLFHLFSLSHHCVVDIGLLPLASAATLVLGENDLAIERSGSRFDQRIMIRELDRDNHDRPDIGYHHFCVFIIFFFFFGYQLGGSLLGLGIGDSGRFRQGCQFRLVCRVRVVLGKGI